jgi:D-alanyl-D-alanine carboxypeptidase
MKNRVRLKSLALAVICAICSFTIEPVNTKAADYWPEGPAVTSPNVIVMEANTGTILYEKNSHEQHYPASITKIMTTLLALENSSMSDMVTFSHDAVHNTEGSGIARDVGEQMTMEQCLYGVMLASANECAYAVAEKVGGGNINNFVDMMNKRATEIGCKNTHFANPHGLTDPNHYTSCYDMALIAKEAYKNENFRILTGTARYKIPPTNKHSEETCLQNHNEMLYPFRTTKYKYQYCTGGKTGYTDEANSTLVTFAEKDGMKLICVIMNTTSPAQWTDSINLYNYCFDNFQVLNVLGNETRYSNKTLNTGTLNANEAYAKLDKNGEIVIPKTAEFSEAVPTVNYDKAKGDILASLDYTFAGHAVGGANIVTTGVKIESFKFDNMQQETETQQSGAPQEKSVKKVLTINLTIIFRVIVGIALITGAVYLLKKYGNRSNFLRRKVMPKLSFRRRKYRVINSGRKSKFKWPWKRR